MTLPRGALERAEGRVEDPERLIASQNAQLAYLRRERSGLAKELATAREAAQQAEAALVTVQARFDEEHTTAATHVRTVEDRAHAEVDRARQEVKELRRDLARARRERAGMAREIDVRTRAQQVAEKRAVAAETRATTLTQRPSTRKRKTQPRR